MRAFDKGMLCFDVVKWCPVTIINDATLDAGFYRVTMANKPGSTPSPFESWVRHEKYLFYVSTDDPRANPGHGSRADATPEAVPASLSLLRATGALSQLLEGLEPGITIRIDSISITKESPK